MGDAAQIEMIQAFGAIVVAIVTAFSVIGVGMINRTMHHARDASRNTAGTLNEVKNDHPTNLRDDLDRKFEGLAGLFKQLTHDVGGMKADIRGIRTDATNDREAAREALADERERIRRIERTLTPQQRALLRDDT